MSDNLQSIVAKVNSLSVDKQQALIALLKKQGIDISPYVVIPRSTTESDDDIQLSFAQQRLWFLAKLEDNSGYYNIPRAWRLSGRLDKQALFRALQEITTRHSVLRTSFVEREGVPYQCIDSPSPLVIQEGDVYSEAHLLRLCEEEALAPFDLGAESLVRLTLLKKSEIEHILLVTMHHSISDGWSLTVFINEVKSLYTSYCAGESSKLKPLQIQYSDFARWQRHWLTGDVKEKQLGYWREQLKDINAQLVLPTDRPRPAVKTYNGSREGFLCPPELLEDLRKLSDEHGATLYMTLLSGFMILLRSYTQQTDLTIGTPIANRDRSELENLIGLFVNTLVIRSDLSGDPTFAELLGRVKMTALDAFSHKDIPFESVVDALDLERSRSYSPLFQVMFVLQESVAQYNDKLVDLAISQVDYDFKIAKYDLTLDLQETAKGLEGLFEYNSDLFDRSTIKRFADHYLNLLSQVIKNPERRLSEYEYLSEAERNQLLVEWNPVAKYATDICLHEMFEKECKISPDRIALTFEDEELTYRQLNERANQVAHCLHTMGVNPDDLVGLCLERSIDMVVAILGILKAGGAYVPIDPASPAERVRYILEDSGAALLLTHSELVPQITVNDKLVVCLDNYDFNGYDTSDIPVSSISLEPKHLAYIIYTSGSTGKPKGVMVEHRNATRLFNATQPEFGFTRDDVWTMFHSFAFDFSVWEMWGALAYGGRIVLVSKATAQSLDDFYTLLVKERVTVLNQTPTVFEQLISVDAVRRENLSLRYVIFGGEALKPAILKPWFDWHGDESIQLINMYGITETTVHVTHHRLRKQNINQKSVIGKKISDLALYVLNEQFLPVPVGITGRMYVGGAGVTRGYLKRPDLTAQRFILNPFGTIDGERLYDTGDLARWLPDGSLEFMGRADDQVKIRGFRIELGEIESRLLEHPTVDSCCVIAREDTPGNKMLVAYLVFTDGCNELDGSHFNELSSFLKTMLPDYMVPSAYVKLERLPVTSNGKVDHKALPQPSIDVFSSSSYAAPRTETEIILSSIWSELLGFDEDKISINDNFFALGGHSLLITKLIARLQAHGLYCDVLTVFTAPTLEVLAASLDNNNVSMGYDVPENVIPFGCDHIAPDMLPLVKLSQEEIDVIVSTVRGGARNIQDIYPLVPSQEGILFHHLMDPKKDPYVIPVLFRIHSKERLDQFMDALQYVIDRHDALRTGVIVNGLAKPVQVVLRYAALPVKTIILTSEVDAEQQMRDKMHEPEVIDITHSPLLRLKVANEPGTDVWYGLFYMHHLIEDATSLKLIIHEMLAHFSSTTNQLERAVPYRDFVAHTQHQLEAYNAEAFFHKKLGDVTETTSPFGLYDVHGDGSDIASLRRSLPALLADEIRSRAKEFGISPASIFHAAWALVVAKCSGREDVVFGTVLSGRLQGVPGVERIVGNFINTLPIRLSLSGKSVAEMVHDTDAELKELIRYEQTSLILAQSCSGVGNDAPLFTAMLNYRHFEENVSAHGSGDIHDFGVEWLDSLDRTNYPVGLSIDDLGNEFSLNVQVDRSLATEAVYSYMESALKGIVTALHDSQTAGTYVLDIEIISDGERTIQIIDWNRTEKPYPSESCLHELFEQLAKTTPNKIAVEFGDEMVTYGQLDARANQLADYLREQGVGPDVLVGLCLRRSIEMVVAILGILKAGGAYVPIDPDYPAERISHIISDSGCRLLITTEKLAEHIPVIDQLLIYMDADSLESMLAGRPKTSLISEERIVTPENLAYVIYTSGSTGKPKGVMVEQRGVVRLVCNPDYFPADPDTVMLHHMSISFDVGSQELLIPLMNGGRLVILQGDAKDMNQIIDCINQAGVTMLSLSAAFLPAFAEAVKTRPIRLTYLGVGGEAFSACDVKSIYDSLENITIVNAYGPTENSIASTCYVIPRDIPLNGIIPIGMPIAQTQAYVVDKNLCLVPIGVIGELCVGGDGVARGYLNNAELTSERFVKNPFSDKEAARLYRTGDLVRWNADGQLEFKGRCDSQVKVRGFRIELGEIENVLGAHPAVNNAIVSTYSAGENDVRLVAHICPTAGCLDELSQAHNDENLKRWTTVFDDQYEAVDQAEDIAEQNYIGWNSSYTGEPISQEQMEEWVSGTVDRIRDLHPKKLLEIGCGTGLLLYRYALVCDFVQAIDISESALRGIQKQLDRKSWKHVSLTRSDALNLEQFAQGCFDTVVVNSVIQYFPNRLYLEQMISDIIRCMVPGGKIFIGDVRNLDLFDAHLIAIERCQANSPIKYDVLTSRIHRRAQQETELLISPSFFTSLTELIPEIERVDILVKKGIGDNEMLSYRFDVVLTTRAEADSGGCENAPIEWYPFSNVENVFRMLESNAYDAFGIHGFVNGRVQEDVLIADNVLHSVATGMVTPIKQKGRLSERALEQVEQLADMIRFAESHGYRCEATWSQENTAHLDIIFAKGNMPQVQARSSYVTARLTNYPQISLLGQSLSKVFKNHLSGLLPDYMIPSTYILLETLPLTPNGKVDKSSLPKPDDSDYVKANYLEPRTETEKVIGKLFQELLGVDKVGVFDNFFDLGGHSLIVVRLVSRVKQLLGKDLPFKAIFENATVELLASAIQSQEDSTDNLPIVARTRTEEGVPLSLEQDELWFLRFGDSYVPSNENVLSAYRLIGKVNIEALVKSVKEVVQRHEMLRTSFIDVDGEVRQVVNSPSVFRPLISTIESESQFFELCLEEKSRTFHRYEPYLFRFHLVKHSDDESFLIISRPWGLFDGWSTGVMMKELEVLYQNYCESRSADLPLPMVQYSDFVLWQQTTVSKARLDAQVNYWRKTLANYHGELQINSDYARTDFTGLKAAKIEITLSPELVAELQSFCQVHGVTLYMVLLSAYSVLLSGYTEQQDICVLSPVSKRSTTELDHVIGYFVNVVAMRLSITRDMRYTDLISRTKKVAIEAFANKDLPFSKVVKMLGGTANSSLFNVMFNLIRLPDAEQISSGLKLVPVELSKDATNFDLSLVLYETSTLIQGYLEYNADLFREITIKSMMERYQIILKTALQNPNASVAQLISKSNLKLGNRI
ncbi:non-ribosomal peptide synthetase [Brevibacillus laterosporus]|uniref:non-ribosomal peptide synthetase n=1 Tax=Brevibacillus laterosporus TaxID=1465 RepID=UPI000CE36FC9|nr:non-ribosomal peptide synthetase [Brevibacillus laterosporus]PPA87727.1 non-ribosomal peptide synthetase [Brevibacillus laterosporus]